MNIKYPNPYYTSIDQNYSLILGDSLEILNSLPDESIDVVFADPPYFLSNDGITCSGGKMVSVNKGSWDKKNSFEDIYQFNLAWLKEAKRILKPNGTLWVSGTLHNIYTVGFILQKLDYKILNNITWQKTNPPPNLACRTFTHSTETIIWAKKSKKAKHYFNYDLMKSWNSGKQMKDVWTTSITKKSEKSFGKHPTQKPLELLERIILSSTQEGDVVLDPFNGSGTTGVACYEYNRNYIGIDINPTYLDITINRINHTAKKFSI
ncbi:site-specific DNA-methyltransferase [Rummeliibacillus sp. TYF005]|uniref:DNA-methyltransferase n=1 Tax=Rummeliibacillus sp. TYF005 TaxID=2058214 RepID=UPI000F548684|nr:site-specific DNA-methyltransferase [Rummeliibacillus sp. TYF005]RPJ97231.1 site-specific DNA-methyltransferase [Rummeliibacillus sp. TYF005]